MSFVAPAQHLLIKALGETSLKLSAGAVDFAGGEVPCGVEIVAEVRVSACC
jgi:hypothetical protein